MLLWFFLNLILIFLFVVKFVEVSSVSSNIVFLMFLIFIGSFLFRMSMMNCYNIIIFNGRILVVFLCLVKLCCGIFVGGIIYKGGMDLINCRNL